MILSLRYRIGFILVIQTLLLTSRAQQPPNVVFILADDLGWSDSELYGTTTFYETPNINELRERGMLFTQAYTGSPVCSPTRSSIMTGKYLTRFGITNARCNLPEVRMRASLPKSDKPSRKALDPIFATRLDTTELTMAEVFQQNGYKTGHFGKWHLGLPPYDASGQGFDIAVPTDPERAILKGYLVEQLGDWTFDQQVHVEDVMAQKAKEFMVENKNRPFFLNYWAFSIHSPWSAKEEYTTHYADKVDLLSPQRNPVYAAMVQSLDEAVGVLLHTLDSLGLFENTIVIFTSDNGGNTWAPPRTEPPGYEHIPGTSNAPMRAGKGWQYEGGTRVPLVMTWPNQIQSNSLSTEQITSVDFLPTLMNLIDLPTSELDLDGISFKPALKGENIRERPIFMFHPHYNWGDRIPPAAWVRLGDWKLIKNFCNNADQTDELELYNLARDISETSPQGSRFPEKEKELNRILDEWLQETGAVIPKPNPNYQK